MNEHQQRRELSFPGSSEFAFSPDGKQVALGTADGSVLIVPTNEDSTQSQVTWRASEFQIASIAYSADGRFIATAGSDESIRIWNAQTQELVKVFVEGSKVFAIAFSPTGARSFQVAMTSTSESGTRLSDHENEKTTRIICPNLNEICAPR